MADKKLEAWGGDVRLPHFLQRLRRRPQAQDTPEKLAEAHKGKVEPPDKSVLENADRTVWGGFRDLPK
jgi:hypothetical protein